MGSGNMKKFELKLGRTGLIIVIAGMALLLCSSFILGVTVGKNMDTYPGKISSLPQQVLALFWRPAKVANQQTIVAGKEPGSTKGNIDLTFHNALTSQKTPSTQQPLATVKKQDDAMATDQKAKPQLPPLAVSPREEAVAKKEEAPEQKTSASEKPLVESKTKIKEPQTSVLSGGPSFLVHVASLKDKARANQINKTVVELGYKSKVVKVDIKGKGTWYRVITTGFETKTRAQAAADRIARKVKTNCIIRQADADTDKNQ
jgi:cell division protein FtsN